MGNSEMNDIANTMPMNNDAASAKQNAEKAFLDPNRRRTEGHVTFCDAREVLVSAEVDPSVDFMENYWAVGQLITIRNGESRVIGQTSKVTADASDWVEGGRNKVLIHVELIGEIIQTEKGPKFTTGISSFPQMGCPAHRIRSGDFAAIYDNDAETTIKIGHLTQDRSIDAKIDFEKLLSRHFAVVGSTGVGKSTSVTLMLRKIVEARPDIRVLLLDPHNEFGSAFPTSSLVINASTLTLPFWLFGLDEISEVIFRGQEGVDLEREMLRDFVVAAKQTFMDEANAAPSITRKQTNKVRLNADTPVPYRMLDLIKLIDDRMGKLDNKSEKPALKSLKDRIETIVNDARFQFMFDPTTCGGDKINEIVSRIFRIPQNGKPISVVEMSGLPSEVVSSVVSVLCRMAFDLALSSEGAIQTLVVCEEAHRYIPADPNAGFWPTRLAIGRIAKEGRKYGVFLGIITQRPGELDPTILSQCNSFFAMRLSNRKDQEIIAGAFSSGAQSTIAFLPSISNRECIAFGEAVYSPMRMTFETVAARDLPGANIKQNQDAIRAGRQINLNSVISRMRGVAERSQNIELDELAELKIDPTPTPQVGEGLHSRKPDGGQQLFARAAQPQAPLQPQMAGQGLPPPRTLEPQLSPRPAISDSLKVQERYSEMKAAAQPASVKSENAGNALFRAFRSK